MIYPVGSLALPIPCGIKQQYGVHLISCGSLSVYFGVYGISYGLIYHVL